MRDYILDRFEELSGGRIYHMYMIPGGVRADFPSGLPDACETRWIRVKRRLMTLKRTLFHNAVFKKRAKGLGILHPDISTSTVSPGRTRGRRVCPRCSQRSAVPGVR